MPVHLHPLQIKDRNHINVNSFIAKCKVRRPGGGIGRHAGLKILWPSGRAGSSPAPGTL